MANTDAAGVWGWFLFSALFSVGRMSEEQGVVGVEPRFLQGPIAQRAPCTVTVALGFGQPVR